MACSYASGCVADLYARTSSCCQSIVSPSCLSFSHAIDYVLAAGDLINCGAMAGGKKCVELTAIACERKRMRASFAASEPLHRLRVEYVNFAWAAVGNGETCVHTMGAPLTVSVRNVDVATPGVNGSAVENPYAPEVRCTRAALKSMSWLMTRRPPSAVLGRALSAEASRGCRALGPINGAHR